MLENLLQQDPHQQAKTFWITEQYDQARQVYEQLIVLQPEQSLNYWYLGLAYLLLEQEEEAQFTWAIATVETDGELTTLLDLLEAEAQRQQTLGHLHTAWLVRKHLLSLDQSNLDNFLRTIHLSLQLERFDIEYREQPELFQEIVRSAATGLPDSELLELIELLLPHKVHQLADSELIQCYTDLIQFCTEQLRNRESAVERLMKQAQHHQYVVRNFDLACQFAEICLKLNSNHGEVLGFLAFCYRYLNRHEEAIALAKRCYEEFCETLLERLSGNSLRLITTMTAGGKWQDAELLYEQQKSLLIELNQQLQAGEVLSVKMRKLGAFFHFPYFEDQPQIVRPIQNQLGQHCYQQLGLQQGAKSFYSARSRLPHLKTLRIGYLSRNFRKHSIGWLARWLLRHHSDRIQSYVYFLSQQQPCAFGEEWYVKPATRATCVEGEIEGIAQLIYQDEIDILIDLESLSSEESLEIMALKPAPIQATWLGLDASGNPAIDYFIADPYVLPASAQDYYSETIWRLPQTYIAVDGFEVGVPTLKRHHLNIPNEAIVYFSSQTAMKRHPETARLQMRIIKSVPNSYFLVKGLGDQNTLRTFFERIAEEEGVAIDRLRFLPMESLEETHRANLGIADIVLDTFPYNGATTTLETLWMGIPLVTQVGQQFAARNSYTMMMNAGITEGLAWNAEEYVEWGIRLGQDVALRETIARKLKQSRQIAPLWNAEAFAQEMENAYAQMWQIYTEAGTSRK